MKKSIKKLLVLTQVLGWSALVATACTDNDKPVGQKADVKSDKKTTSPQTAPQGEHKDGATGPTSPQTAPQGEHKA